jgi:hypothetical protein
MTKITTKILLIVSAVALLAIGYALGVGTSKNALGGTSYDAMNFVGDVSQGLGKVLMMQNGVFVGPIATSKTVTIGSAGSAVSLIKCGTATWNPASITSSTDSYASTSVTITGATVNDVTWIPSLGTTTNAQDLRITSKVSTTSTVLVLLTASKTVDLATTTIKACVMQ